MEHENLSDKGTLAFLVNTAIKFEEKAKKERDFNKKAELFFNAATIWEKIGDLKNSSWNYANYYSTLGKIYFKNNEFDKAVENFKKAEQLFNEIKIFKAALYCATRCVEALSKTTNPSAHLQLIEHYLKKYRLYQDDLNYILININYYKLKSISCRLHGEYEKAIVFAQKCYELAEQGHSKFKKKYLRKISIFNKHIFWNLKAKKFEAERHYLEAAECYKNSAEIISELDVNRSYDEYVNYYKCLAIANKFNPIMFEEYITKAIEYSAKRNDDKQTSYLLGLRDENLVKFNQNIEKRIDLLRRAKENYYKAGDINSGKLVEYLLFYYLSRKMLKDRQYVDAINYLKKAINLSRKIDFSNKLTLSPKILESELALYESYLHFSQANFSEAISCLNRWLEQNHSIANTRKYQFYKLLKYCCEILNKNEVTEEDLYDLEETLAFIRENKISLALYKICSLVYVYVLLKLEKMGGGLLNDIKLKVISKITGDELLEDLRSRLEIQNAIEQRSWLLRYPPIFIESFDKCVYLLENVLDEYKHVAIREFYILIENIMRIVIEFNAKIVWGNNWKSKLEQMVTNNKKPFEVFTFGDLVQSLNKIRNYEKAKYCRGLPDDVFKLLETHTEIRNRLSHSIFKEQQKLDVAEDISKIMYILLRSFPTCIRVIDSRRKPWYHVEILWNLIPKKISMYFEGNLDEGGFYYIDPMLEVFDNGIIRPKVVIAISCLESLGIHSTIKQKDIIFKKSKKEILSHLVFEIIEFSDNHDYIVNLLKREFPLMDVSHKKFKQMFFELFSHSFLISTEKNSFNMSFTIFKLLLKIGQKLHGDFIKKSILSEFSRTVPYMFKNIIFSKNVNAAKCIEIKSKDDLITLLRDFERTFGSIGVKVPTLDQIRKVCEEEIEKVSYPATKQKYREILEIIFK
ncbi:tetratricopeptide repeat protein [Archaeoglobus sp.]